MQTAPEAALQMFQSLGQGQARQLLRFQAAELNRFNFESWEIAQIPLGLALLATLALGRGTRLQLSLVGLMLLSVTASRFLLTPELIGIGRLLDFESANAAQLMLHRRFSAFHGMYMGLEVLKLGLGVLLGGVLLYRRRGESLRGEFREEVDAIHNADNRHVNRR
jgi:hypothetical protein